METADDLLNFKLIANIATRLVFESNGEPVSIGVSGKWGTGKSSLVKMIGQKLQDEGTKEKYIFLEFNAWLYQGYDDAKLALLQSVSDKILSVAQDRKNFVEKAFDFAKRIDYFRAIKIAAPAAAGALWGGAIGGPVGSILGIVSGIISSKIVTSDDLDLLQSEYSKISPNFNGLLKPSESKSLPKQIEELRISLTQLLKDLDITLVVLVDDLDRCMPNTAISTLEAMRLLLFVPRTAFIIAADEGMIRSAVRSHFSQNDLDSDLVTNYFDKLIQVPLRVPRLSTNDVKAYVVILFSDLASRKGVIPKSVAIEAKKIILEKAKNSWQGSLNRKEILNAFGPYAEKIETEISIAIDISAILASTKEIAGNPRLIKRFLNNLIIRQQIAEEQGLAIAFEELVKLQLFERCATTAAFDFLARSVTESEDGKPEFIEKIESDIQKGNVYTPPDPSWRNDFIESWVEIKPSLSSIDLRPLLYLSREKFISISNMDDISDEARNILESIIISDDTFEIFSERLKEIGEIEAEKIFSRLKVKCRSEQWSIEYLKKCLFITSVYESMANEFTSLLREIPGETRPASLIPLINKNSWAIDLLESWEKDSSTNKQTVNAIKLKFRR
ncbi:P-loop NTPase fold protein [Pectobacterium brasiliense]|uniref:KAP family P-loop NTPase fold protein n=1 Tax=Pectobacterium TaxID=122277 RepID=UPI001CD4FEDF|nr:MULTISPECIES: P-loop NTPase fold protein [Pectobacterium]MDY4366988.1 P-loop NTPase fold protein [Pectobacterium brasiliense]MDY7056411.1 P-loop NTPase fold protein [Pectobacterium brasiliense]